MFKIPLSVPYLRGNELQYVTECVKSEWVSSVGSFVTRFERDLCAFTGAQHAVACCNGTSALHTALMVAGVGAGDEVIVPTVTFIAPVNAVRYVNAAPVFMDCDDHLNMDADKLAAFCEAECSFVKGKLVDKKTKAHVKAVVPVHVFGNPCDMEKIMAVAERFNLIVIEDASESLGSYIKGGKYHRRKTGTIGHIGCFSFNGNKIITTGGGGMLVTGNAEYHRKALYLINQAKDDGERYIHDEVGYNYRMTNLQAALGCAQLEKIDKYVGIKRQVRDIYRLKLRGVEGLRLLDEPPYGFSNFWLNAVLIDKKAFGIDRDALQRRLKEQGIESRPLWQLNHLQKPYRECRAYRVEKAPKLHAALLNIPSSIGLSEDEAGQVAAALAGGNK